MFQHETKILQELKDGGYEPAVVYDIGASTGIWSETISSVLHNSELYLFEPLADVIESYRIDLELRSKRMRHFHLHPIALSDAPGVAEFFVTHDGYSSSMLDRGNIPEVKQRVAIRKYRLDDYIVEHDLPQPDVIKIDSQGAERMILDGGRETLAHADILFLETWFKRGYGPHTPLLGELIEYLAAKGFTLVDTGEKSFDDKHRLYSIDAFFFAERFLARQINVLAE
jgi:FkbM family methyltransferase